MSQETSVLATDKLQLELLTCLCLRNVVGSMAERKGHTGMWSAKWPEGKVILAYGRQRGWKERGYWHVVGNVDGRNEDTDIRRSAFTLQL